MKSSEKMQMQLRISKSNYGKQGVEIMIHQELNQMWMEPSRALCDLVMALRIPGLQKSFLKLFKCTEGPVIVLKHNPISQTAPDFGKCLWHPSHPSDTSLPTKNFESIRNTA